MTCTTEKDMSEQKKAAQKTALDRLKAAIAANKVGVVIGRNGAFALKGWADADRAGISDLCAYRALANTPEMRRAVLRAEAIAGTKLSMIAVIGGTHSHDGGSTWHSGH